MATSSRSAVAAFLSREHFKCAISVFDSRRGQHEGHEHEKVLGFFPTSAALPIRTSIVGLAQALTSFTDSFSKDEGSTTKVMEAEQNRWVMIEMEPHIWFLMVVNKAWLGQGCSNPALQAFLRMLHAVYTLLHGPISRMLELDPSGHQARRTLQPLADEAGRLLLGPAAAAIRAPAPTPSPSPSSALSAAGASVLGALSSLSTSSLFGSSAPSTSAAQDAHGGSPASSAPPSHTSHTPEAANLANPLGQDAMHMPLLATPRAAFLAVQCLASQLLTLSLPWEAGIGASHRLVHSVVVSWAGHPVWGTLPIADMTPLHALTQRALLPAAGIAWRGAAGGKQHGALGSAPDLVCETLLNPHQWRVQAPPAPAAARRQQPVSPAAPTTSQSSTSYLSAGIASSATTAVAAAAAVAGVAANAVSAIMSLPLSPVPQPPPPTPSYQQAAEQAAAAALAKQPGGQNGRPIAGFLFPKLRQPITPRDSFMSGGLGMGPVAQSGSTGSTPTAPTAAKVWLGASQEQCLLLPYYHGPLLVLVLLQDGTELTQATLSALAEVLSKQSVRVAAQLMSCVPPKNLWHEPGYRYCHTDSTCAATRASPAKKVATLGSATLRLLAHVRNKQDYWGGAPPAAAPKSPGSGPGSAAVGTVQQAGAGEGIITGSGLTGVERSLSLESQPGGWGLGEDGWAGVGASGEECDLVCKGSHDGWVVSLMRPGPRRMLVGLEAPAAPTLPGITSHVHKLCDKLYPGYY